MSELAPIPAGVTGANKTKKFDLRACIEHEKPEMDKAVSNAERYPTLDGRGGRFFVVCGVRNESSIAWNTARVLHAAGARIVFTYQNDKTLEYTEGLFKSVNSPYYGKLDIINEDQARRVVNEINEVSKGSVDGLVHSIAGGAKQRGDLAESLLDVDEQVQMDTYRISALSFIKLAKLFVPLMYRKNTDEENKALEIRDREDPNLIAYSYEGGERVVDVYNAMGPAKAALNYIVRGLAADPKVGARGIRVNGASPGPISTMAASGINNFDRLLEATDEQSPQGLPSMADVANISKAIVSPDAAGLNGTITYIDRGANAVKMAVSKYSHRYH